MQGLHISRQTRPINRHLKFANDTSLVNTFIQHCSRFIFKLVCHCQLNAPTRAPGPINVFNKLLSVAYSRIPFEMNYVAYFSPPARSSLGNPCQID